MRELFLKVDKRLNRVTELLFEASAGDMSSAGEIGSAGIDELIREAAAARRKRQEFEHRISYIFRKNFCMSACRAPS